MIKYLYIDDESNETVNSFTDGLKDENLVIIYKHVDEINSKDFGLKSDSIVLAEQIRTIDKSRLKERIGHIDNDEIIGKINNALGVSFGLGE